MTFPSLVLPCLLALLALCKSVPVPPLVPWPTDVVNISFDTETLTTINPKSFDIVLQNTDVNDDHNNNNAQDFIQHAKKVYLEKHLFALPDYPETYQPNPNNAELMNIQKLTIEVKSLNTTLHHGVDESYSFLNNHEGAHISATTVFGAIRGIETFCQLLRFGWLNDDNQEPVFVMSPLYIEDKPVYPYRGLLIDTSRHYLPIDLIVKNLDTMAMNKLNVLHWHMVDSQSWPFVSSTYPQLSRKGAYGPHAIYTPRDVQRVIREAYYRGIRVIPEFDMPGHTQAIGAAHPELLSPCPDTPSEPLDPTNPRVYDFVENLYREIVSVFWTADFVHVGGDEVSFDCWNKSSSIQKWKEQHNISDETGLYEHFETKLLHIVADKLQKRTIVWQEVFDLGLPIHKDTIVDVWKDWGNQDVQAMEKATAEGYQVILASCWYLDHLDSDWRDYYKCEPRSFFNGTRAQKDLVVGGHACMWGERVDASDFETRVWPRASSAAERLWSGKTGQDTFYDRMPLFRCSMVRRGIPASPVVPGHCDTEPTHIRPRPIKTSLDTKDEFMSEE